MIRQITFNPPGEPPAIYWMEGHVSIFKFRQMMGNLDNAETIKPADIVQGWGTRKLSDISLSLSDEPLPNYEPITYWIAPERIFA